MTEKIDRYIIEEPNLLSRGVSIFDRKEGKFVCKFNTKNKKLNKELAEYCLKRIREK